MIYLTNNFNRYNTQSHPLPFMKASSVMAPKQAKKEMPDLEEAIEESDDGELIEEPKDDDEGDLSKDKYIKAPKKKAAPKAKAAGKGKKRAVDSDAEDSEPKKTKASSSKSKGKAKAKK
jgi:replication factor C subunit 1